MENTELSQVKSPLGNTEIAQLFTEGVKCERNPFKKGRQGSY